MHGLRHFGDPRLSWRWKTGEVDYVAALGLADADVHDLLAIARQWVHEPDWPQDSQDMSPYAPIHAWRALAQLKAAQAAGPLLDMLDALAARQDDWYLQELPKVFAWMGPGAAAALRDYLADAAHGEFPRACAAQGLKEIAERHPAARDEALGALTDALSHFQDNGATLNSFIIRYLLDMKAPDPAGMIGRANASGRVNPDITGAWRNER